LYPEELIPTTRITKVAFWNPPSGPKNTPDVYLEKTLNLFLSTANLHENRPWLVVVENFDFTTRIAINLTLDAFAG